MGYGIVDASKASGFSIVISPQELHFEVSSGDTQSQQMILNLSDYWQGEGLKWEAITTAHWINIFPDSGITPSQCSVMVHPASLKVGINQDSIVISAHNAINSQQKVLVVLTIQATAQVQAFPNPFSDYLTVIAKRTDTVGKIKVGVFTVAGELVYEFPEKSYFGSGQDGEKAYQQTWGGRNEKGEEVANGIYLLKIDIDDKSQIVKVAKIK